MTIQTNRLVLPRRRSFRLPDVWAILGGKGLLAQTPWPSPDPPLLIEDTVTLPIQVNGKRRSELTVAKDLPKDEVEKLALADAAV